MSLQTAGSSRIPRTFRGFDTETVNRPGGGHACLLLARDRYLEFPKGWRAIFDFLTPDEGLNKWVCWNMDFDARAIFHWQFLPMNILEDVALKHEAGWRGWRFSYIPGKFFEASKNRRSFILYDLMQFFGMGLEKAAETYLPASERKRAIPESWYNEMDKALKDHRRAEVIDYGLADVRALEGLLGVLLSSLERIGIKPAKLISAAYLAKRLYGLLLKREQVPLHLNRAWRRAFYGGRVEVGCLGRTGPVNLYDLRSAYPSEIAKLRRLKGLRLKCWEPGAWRETGSAVYGLYRIRAKIPSSWNWGPLAVSDGTRNIYPVGIVETWCARPAIETLSQAGVKFTVLEAMEFRGDTPLIFSDIEERYEARKDPALALALKLTLNSIYGVLAESRNRLLDAYLEGRGVRRVAGRLMRSQGSFGRYANFILASHITEAVRMKVWRVLHEFQDQAHFAATDGVLVSGQIPIGKFLGEWDLKDTYTDAVILGCGRYAFFKGKNLDSFHLRGFRVGKDFVEGLAICRSREVRAQVIEAETLRSWVMSYGYEELNVLDSVKRILKVEDMKRFWPANFLNIGSAFCDRIESRPYLTGPIRELQKEITP